MLILIEHGYTAVDAGLALQAGALQATFYRQQAASDQLAATKAVKDAHKAARKAYSEFRQMAHIIFKAEAARTALSLKGRVPADRARFLHQARASYEAALTPEYAPILAQRGFPRPVIEAASALLDVLVAAEDAQTTAKAAAQQATAARKTAVAQLDAWFIPFRDIAKLALRDHSDWVALLKIR